MVCSEKHKISSPLDIVSKCNHVLPKPLK